MIKYTCILSLQACVKEALLLLLSIYILLCSLVPDICFVGISLGWFSYINRLDKMTSHSISIKYIHIPTNVFD